MADGRIGKELTGPDGEQFKIEDRLGNGSFGEVYRAIGLASGMVAAVKMVPPKKLRDPYTLAVRSVLNEGRLGMMKVSHPNVVRVLHVDEGKDPGVGPYLMMEYVPGGSLQSLLDRRRTDSRQLSLDEALALMRGIALGAQAVNEHLIHRDIKPDNILLDGPEDAPRPRIADFGISKAVADPTRPETFKGIQAVWYMAPEVRRQEKNTPKIDVYSVGLVFYEILTFSHPLLPFVPDPTDWVRWREVHLTVACLDVRAARPEVPLALAKLLIMMTDKSPGNRPRWDDVLAGLNSGPAQPSPQASVDPQLLAAMKRQADECLKEERTRTEGELKRRREAERGKHQGEEYKQSARRLITGFDAIVEALNRQEGSYPITVGGDGTFSRNYRLPNSHEVKCHIFGHGVRRAGSSSVPILGGGYIGVGGGLSANLILQGQPDDISSARWSAVEVTVMALIAGQARLKWYREAGVDNQTIRYVEYMDGNQSWRRDSPSFFGFVSGEKLFEHYSVGSSAMHVYSFRVEPDVISTFNQILLLGLQMPRSTR